MRNIIPILVYLALGATFFLFLQDIGTFDKYNPNASKTEKIKWTKKCVNPRSYQIDIYDEGGTNDSIRIYDGERLIGKVYVYDSSRFTNLILKDNE